MSQYILVMVWLVLIYIISQTINVYKSEYVLGKKEIRVRVGFAIFAVIPLIWWAATRPLSFGDCLLSSKLQKNMSEKWLLFKKATFSDCIEGSFL